MSALYVAVKGGERAIANAHRLLAHARRGDRSVPALTLEQISEQLALAVDRVMTEGSLYDRELAALAIRQARGDLIEAIFLARAYRTTLPRFGGSEPVDTAAMQVERRISATYKDLPGGQVLGPTFDYTHHLLDFAEASDVAEPARAPADPAPMPRVTDLLGEEGLIEASPAAEPGTPIGDLTREPDVRLVSLMDHTPGQRQFRDPVKLRNYYRGKKGGLTDAELGVLIERRRAYQRLHAAENHRALVDLARRYNTPLASHDDTTLEHVAQSMEDGVAIAEFPTTVEGAEALHAAGVRVMMGAPNLVRGGSHSGNMATSDLAERGMLDILSSDYVPASLLMAALRLPDVVSAINLAAAVATVTKTPATAVGLADRGEIAAGKRADLIRVHFARGVPAVRCVWREGRRVA